MNDLPLRCVVDTNVPRTANGENHGASSSCTTASARALREVTERGHLFLDGGNAIFNEYRKGLSLSGQPGPGDAFLKWVLTNQWNASRVTRVKVTRCGQDLQDFEELPQPPQNVFYDPSDRVFLAVAATHSEKPPILQSLDSKWWGWQEALEEIGVSIYFLCPEEIEQKHREKMES